MEKEPPGKGEGIYSAAAVRKFVFCGGIRNIAVILSEQSEPKDPGISFSAKVNPVRRSFDSGLCPPLRMTTAYDA